MNRLVLLGNGFDLAHGLPTKYEHFIFNYTIEEIRRCLNRERVNNFKDLFNLKILHNPNLNRKNISISSSLLQVKSKNDLIDFVTTYFTLNEVNHHSDINKGKLTFFNYTNHFAKNLVVENNGSNWSEIEAFFYKKLIVESGVKNFKNIDELDKIRYITDVKRLNEGFEKVKLALEYYLTEYVENKFKFKPHQKFIDILIGNKDTKSTCLLNFNYTKTAEMYLSDLNKSNPTELINIHGKLNDDKESPMIFGYGDRDDKMYAVFEEFNEISLFDHIKSFGYPKARSYRNMKKFADEGKYEIFMIGHSCALSDRTLLKYLFENKNCASIRIFYREGKDLDSSRNNHNNTTRAISRHFTNKVDEDKIVNFLDSEPCPQVQLKEIT